jgi:phosphopantothenoylcysteine decarboxylase / phosphopantothenate---cysteine ligase
MGADVTLVSGPVSLAKPFDMTVTNVQTADEMLKACEGVYDVVICAAAVADWKVAQAANNKIKKSKPGEVPSLSFIENPDILATVSKAGKHRAKMVVGFAAETENVVENAKSKLAKKGCDLIVANDVSETSGVFGGDKNIVHLVSANGVENWPQLSKTEVAERLMTHIAGLLK